MVAQSVEQADWTPISVGHSLSPMQRSAVKFFGAAGFAAVGSRSNHCHGITGASNPGLRLIQ